MDEIILRTGFLKIHHSISFQPQTENKGKKLVLANHVVHVEEHRKKDGGNFVKAKVIRQTSVNEKPYDTILYLDSKRQVIRTLCSCVYNKSEKCKHIAALIYYINNEESLSKTDYEQQWGKPSAQQFAKEKYAKGKFFEEMFPPSKSYSKDVQYCQLDYSKLIDMSPYKKLVDEAKKSVIERAVDQLLKEMLVQVEKIIEEEKCTECVRYFLEFSRKHTIFSNRICISKDLFDFYMKYIVISEEESVRLCCATVKQSSSDLWFIVRNLRFSASSNIHSIKTQTRKTTEALVNEILHPKKIDTVSTRYGLRMEKEAKAEYEKLYNCTLKEVGVFISPSQPWLCASLDGVAYQNNKPKFPVEFKSSHKCAKEKLPVISGDKSNVDYLSVKDGVVYLKNTFKYYTQCQVQMYLTGFNDCDLFTYSPFGSCCVHVSRDEKFLQKEILRSERFYFEHYLPALAQFDVIEKIKSVKVPDSAVKPINQTRSFTGLNIVNKISRN